MDSKTHGEMIGGSAKIDARVGGKFEIWDGSIKGKTLELNPKKRRIVQEWRYNYNDWSENEPSTVTIQFVPHKNNRTKINFSQENIPDKYAQDISEGWSDYYWKPMQDYFKNS